MKFLPDTIYWNKIKAVGFDMDGTLYDEFEFITQVYVQISKIFAQNEKDAENIYVNMLERWLEKGSSYPYIFGEILDSLNYDSSLKEKLLNEALRVFRNFKPNIKMSSRVLFILNNLKSQYELFLVTDGSSVLQWNKIRSLQLEKYFTQNNIFVSGSYGVHVQKPSIFSLQCLDVFKNKYEPSEIVFIGDRGVDMDFAKNAGFHFINAKEINF